MGDLGKAAAVAARELQPTVLVSSSIWLHFIRLKLENSPTSQMKVRLFCLLHIGLRTWHPPECERVSVVGRVLKPVLQPTSAPYWLLLGTSATCRSRSREHTGINCGSVHVALKSNCELEVAGVRLSCETCPTVHHHHWQASRCGFELLNIFRPTIISHEVSVTRR